MRDQRGAGQLPGLVYALYWRPLGSDRGDRRFGERKRVPIVAESVKRASPANFRISSERSPAALFPAPHASSTTTGM